MVARVSASLRTFHSLYGAVPTKLGNMNPPKLCGWRLSSIKWTHSFYASISQIHACPCMITICTREITKTLKTG